MLESAQAFFHSLIKHPLFRIKSNMVIMITSPDMLQQVPFTALKE
jgi:hypothetical protein